MTSTVAHHSSDCSSRSDSMINPTRPSPSGTEAMVWMPWLPGMSAVPISASGVAHCHVRPSSLIAP